MSKKKLKIGMVHTIETAVTTKKRGDSDDLFMEGVGSKT